MRRVLTGDAVSFNTRHAAAGIFSKAVCRYMGADAKDLIRPTRRAKVAQARGLISYLATQELSIPGCEVSRRFHQDLSSVSRAAQRVSEHGQLMLAARKILEQLYPGISQL
jgi:chromosomal replication initiation ATPase DnaA